MDDFSSFEFGVGVAAQPKDTHKRSSVEVNALAGECCVPATIRMLDKAFQANKDVLHLHNKQVAAATICGWVCHIENLASQTYLTLSDGTGNIAIVLDGAADNPVVEKLKSGSLITVVGSVRESDDKKTACVMDACSVRPLTDYDEYASFAPIEVVFAACKLAPKATIKSENTPPTKPPNVVAAIPAAKWESTDVSQFAHLSSDIQLSIIKVLKFESSVEGFNKEVPLHQIQSFLRNKFPDTDVTEAVRELADEGEIVPGKGDVYSLPL